MKKSLIASIFLLLMFTNAYGEQNKWYSGFSHGSTKLDTGITNLTGTASLDEKDSGYKIYTGYKFKKYFSGEIFYADLGSAILKGNTGDTYKKDGQSYIYVQNGIEEVENKSIGLSGIFTYPLHERIEPFIKIGIQRWNSKNTSGLSDNGISSMFGLGLNFPITDKFSIKTEYEEYEVDKDSLGFLSLGLVYLF